MTRATFHDISLKTCHLLLSESTYHKACPISVYIDVYIVEMLIEIVEL